MGTSVRQKIGFEKVLKMGVSVSRFLPRGLCETIFAARQDFTSIGPLGSGGRNFLTPKRACVRVWTSAGKSGLKSLCNIVVLLP